MDVLVVHKVEWPARTQCEQPDEAKHEVHVVLLHKSLAALEESSVSTVHEGAGEGQSVAYEGAACGSRGQLEVGHCDQVHADERREQTEQLPPSEQFDAHQGSDRHGEERGSGGQDCLRGDTRVRQRAVSEEVRQEPQDCEQESQQYQSAVVVCGRFL